MGVVWRCCIDRYALSQREAEVVVFLAAGWTNPEIAAELWLSPRTVARHVTRICDKVGSRTRAGVVGSVLVAALVTDGLPVRDRDLEPAV